MKFIIKPFPLIVWVFSSFISLLNAQTIPNFDFSTWNKTSSETLFKWKVEGKIYKDTLSLSDYGVALKNDTGGLTSIYQVGRRYPDSYTGGFSLNGTPTTINIDYRSDLLKTDTGLVIFGCTKSGDTLPIILQQAYLLTGQGNSTTHAQLMVNLTYIHPTPGLEADSAFVVIYSSLRPKKPNSDGVLILSNVQLGNSSILAENGNLSFNNWSSLSVENPAKWSTSHNVYYNLKSNELSSFQLSSKFNNGIKNTLELKSTIVTQGAASDTIAAWAISSSSLNPNLDVFRPTFIYTLKSGAMQLDWTGNLNNGDRLTATVNFFRGDSVIGSGTFSKTGFNYTQNASVPAIENIVWLPGYTEMPEYATVKVWLSDSSFSTHASTSSVARISKITFLPYGTGIHRVKNNTTLSIYPNPCTTELKIKSSEKIQIVHIMNNQGQIVFSSNNCDSMVQIPTHLAAGNYWLNIQSNSGTTTKHFQIIR